MGVASPICSASNKSISLQVKVRKRGSEVEIAEL